MKFPFDSMYEADERGQEIFYALGDAYSPPPIFRHGEWELVATLPKESATSDGYETRVYECRMPARFFKVEAVADTDYQGVPRSGFALSTGSGDRQGELIAEMALAIQRGMLGIAS
jgi:hypothetical protein